MVKASRIKFRGMTHNNEWVYGYFVYKNGVCYILEETDNAVRWNAVYPETVGQYTGFNDRNDVEIYENDIVRIERANAFGSKGEIIGVIQYLPYHMSYAVINCIVKQPNGDTEKWDYTFIVSSTEVEVIGNVFEHSEVLRDVENQTKKHKR